MRITKITLCLLALAIVLAGCAALGIESTKWHVDAWTKNVSLIVANKPGDIFSFDFPNKDGVHSIDKGAKLTKQVSMTYEITGNNPTFTSTENEPGQVGFKFASATIFSNHANRQDLRLGKHTLTVTFSPENWQTIDGIPCNRDAGQIRLFNKAVASSSDISVCYGGTNHGYAHGAYLSGGSAKFHVTSFTP
jgi:hypothetical protein